MKNTRSHAPILEVLAAAEVPPYYSHASAGTSRSMLPIQDEEAWMRDRQRSLDRMRQKKEMRRGGGGAVGENGVQARRYVADKYERDHDDLSEAERERENGGARQNAWRDEERQQQENAWSSQSQSKKRRPSREQHGYNQDALVDREDSRDRRQHKSQSQSQRTKQQNGYDRSNGNGNGNGNGYHHTSNSEADYHHQYPPRYEVEVEKGDMWRAGLAKMPTKYPSRGRRGDSRDGYPTAREALNYSYGQA